MNSPFFWLGISILLVAISLIALLSVAILVLQELARAARSAEKLLDTLNRELPITLQELRTTGRELAGLSDEVGSSVQSARNVVQQVDQGLFEAKAQAHKAKITTRSLVMGAKAALRVLYRQSSPRRHRPPTSRVQQSPPKPAPPSPLSPLPTSPSALQGPPSASATVSATVKSEPTGNSLPGQPVSQSPEAIQAAPSPQAKPDSLGLEQASRERPNPDSAKVANRSDSQPSS